MDSFLYTKYGRNVTTYIKDSFVARVYSNDNNIIVGREIVRTDSLKFYQIDPSSDTMQVTDLTNDYYFSNISLKEVAGKRILGIDCIGILTVNKTVPDILSDSYTSRAIYYLNTSIRLTPGMNKNVKFGNYNKVFGKYPYLNMGSEQEFQGTKISVTAKRVIQNEVNNIMFEVPKGKIEVNRFFH